MWRLVPCVVVCVLPVVSDSDVSVTGDDELAAEVVADVAGVNVTVVPVVMGPDVSVV